jgi:hypothetical protein
MRNYHGNNAAVAFYNPQYAQASAQMDMTSQMKIQNELKRKEPELRQKEPDN